MRSHAYWVTKHAMELSVFADEPVLLVIAAGLHDIGIPYCSGRKIVESEIESSCPERRAELVKQAKEYRIEHMVKGAKVALKVLGDMRMSNEATSYIYEMILEHDVWKIDPQFDYSKDQSLLVEADTLWCFCKDGLERDRQRAIDNGLEPMSLQAQFEHNKKHFFHKIQYGKDIFERYEKLIYYEQDTRYLSGN